MGPVDMRGALEERLVKMQNMEIIRESASTDMNLLDAVGPVNVIELLVEQLDASQRLYM